METQHIQNNIIYEQRIKYISILIFAFYCFMLQHRLMYSPLWGDEWAEFYFSRYDILDGSLYQKIVSTYQPPLYNFIMHFWLMMGGNSILWFRLFNVFLGIAMGYFCYKSVKMISGDIPAIVSLLILACMYHYIWFIQECSEYSLAMTFIFASIYSYIRLYGCEKKWLIKTIVFTILNCLAIYSQYGAIFVSIPLLFVFFVQTLRTKKRSKVIGCLVIYASAMLFFALPLYFFYLRIQFIERIGEGSSSIRDFFKVIGNLPVCFGEILSYLFNVRSNVTITGTLKVLGLIVLIYSFVLIFKRGNNCLRGLAAVVPLSYVIHFILCTAHYYGVDNRNIEDLFTRYSYFYIPVLGTGIVMIVTEMIRFICTKIKGRGDVIVKTIIFSFGLVLLLNALPITLNNWKKAYDDEMVRIWVNNAGFNESTYVLGGWSRNAFDYHTKIAGCKIKGSVLSENNIDGELPNEFWVYYSNWGANSYYKLIERAKAENYVVSEYLDYGTGKLAKCSKLE